MDKTIKENLADKNSKDCSTCKYGYMLGSNKPCNRCSKVNEYSSSSLYEKKYP